MAGEEFQARLLPGVVQYAHAKKNGERDPQQAEEPGFTQADLMQPPIEDTQVQSDRSQNEKVESNPKKRSAHSEARCASGSRSQPVQRVQVGKFDACGLSSADRNSHVPSDPGISGIGIQIQRADPIFSGSEPGSRGAAVQIGICSCGKIFRLRE